MPKPKNKAELTVLSQSNYKKLMDLVDSYTDEEIQREFPEGTMNRNIRDVLAHLHHWHTLLLDWYKVGQTGEKPDMPAKGYTWKTTPELNKHIWQKYQGVDIETVKGLLDTSYASVQELIAKHSDAALFEKKRYKWTGSTSLGAYLISNTSSHYAWAFKLIKRSTNLT